MHAHNPSVYRIGTIGKNCIRRCKTDGLPTDFRSDAATLVVQEHIFNKGFTLFHKMLFHVDLNYDSLINSLESFSLKNFQL